jgi:hypothetical protein
MPSCRDCWKATLLPAHDLAGITEQTMDWLAYSVEHEGRRRNCSRSGAETADHPRGGAHPFWQECRQRLHALADAVNDYTRRFAPCCGAQRIPENCRKSWPTSCSIRGHWETAEHWPTRCCFSRPKPKGTAAGSSPDAAIAASRPGSPRRRSTSQPSSGDRPRPAQNHHRHLRHTDGGR